ncbi:GatB/YqeY domain-containing protein [Glutamicibacter halophytocola]|uniref:GatB/YqeY domain-containing protein n=1 Tax=Glutamicibacter halophytocola TaxID=1933880 RepID=A0A5B8ILB9_9MICC|nr:GatB/YqeY domain-containing protein [Glutamicibacter halophytocola]ALG30238.1 glutamyl-tRNA amidotransferase [Glutamicibacter halophytocola]QDY66514.1 glutamyl-tRNA amidotransferase [Glutamicibacter halophytocola]UUX58627.1 GatB/YqeY domain-containing protein [Glutamicibacter halophytocola]
MSLKDRLREDSIVHLKAGNELEKTTLRNILSAIGTKEKSGKNPSELNDQDVENLLRKEVGNREETAQLAAKDGRTELAERELAEAAFISTYLPKMLDEAEARGIVEKVMAELAADHELSMKDMGQAMKLVGAEIAGRFDGKAVSQMVRAKLG